MERACSRPPGEGQGEGPSPLPFRRRSRIVKTAISYAEGLDPKDELVAEVETMLKTIAPAGLQAVAIIIGRYHGDSQEHVSKRDELLSPIMRQSDEIGAYMKSRRTILDVDPETGEPEPLPAPAETRPPEVPSEPNA
jgi:hypothetical protein